jgi:choline dehydrogenase
MPSAFDLTGSTGNLMIQLPLSNWTNASASIMSQAGAYSPAIILGDSADPNVIRGTKSNAPS